MKKILLFVLSLCVVITFCGCDTKDGAEETNVDNVVSLGHEEGKTNSEDSVDITEEKIKLEEKTQPLIEKAKKVIEVAKCDETDFGKASVTVEDDSINNRKLYTVSVPSGEKNVTVSFCEDGALAKFSSGYVVSDPEDAVYTEDKVDELLEIAKEYYDSLDVAEGYALSGWQMDFGGPDWQVEFTRKIDIKGYEEDVYNYGEQVRMRISGIDGKLLSVNVFNFPLNTDGASEEFISYEKALEISALPEDKLEKSYIGCYTIRDKGYARLCWCFEADLSEDDICNTKWIYVDLYTGEIVGEESCH